MDKSTGISDSFNQVFLQRISEFSSYSSMRIALLVFYPMTPLRLKPPSTSCIVGVVAIILNPFPLRFTFYQIWHEKHIDIMPFCLEGEWTHTAHIWHNPRRVLWRDGRILSQRCYSSAVAEGKWRVGFRAVDCKQSRKLLHCIFTLVTRLATAMLYVLIQAVCIISIIFCG